MKRNHYELIDSTNSEARRLAGKRPGERLLVTAARQSAGRGRHGRVWQSPLGGAWMSIVWPLCKEPLAYAPAALVVAVGVRRALQEISSPAVADFCIKWPNDILLAERKVAGILCERCPGVGSRNGIIILGIGVNVSFDPAELAGELHYPAATLNSSLGRSFAVEEVIRGVSVRVTEAMEAFERDGLSEPLLAELRSSLAFVGTVRTWSAPRGVFTGRVLGLDTAGRLLLESHDGTIACEAGELVAEAADPELNYSSVINRSPAST